MTKIVTPCYVETNTSDPANLVEYKLANGTMLVDIGILFAANIDGTPDEPVLSFNSELKPKLESGVIGQLQDKGLKVTLSILGNHQTAGISNLTDKGVDRFVSQLIAAVDKYKLDGLDFDDEYSNGTPIEGSYIGILNGVRKALPSAILTMYCIGNAMGQLSFDGIDAGDLLNYAWNPWYGRFMPPSVPGMDKSRISAAAMDLTETSPTLAKSLATQTVNDSYGVFMLYNLVNGDQSGVLSSASKELFGQSTIYTGSRETLPT